MNLSCVNLVVAVLGISLHAVAGTWDAGAVRFVATDGVDAAGRGTAAMPWRTLQYAHDNADAGDTISIGPGSYAEGVNSDGKHNNRLVVTKKLRFLPTDGKGTVEIVGQYDSSTGGTGPNAVRCVYVKPEGYDSEFHGLTFRKGASKNGSSADTTGCPRWGGCVHVYGEKSKVSTDDIHRAYFVDCVFAEGAAGWGGGLAGGTAVRCLFRDCTGTSYGSSAMGVAMLNCVVYNDCNSANQRPAVGNNSVVVNCTVYGCAKYGIGRGCAVYNTYLAEVAGTEFPDTDEASTTENCVLGKTDGHELLLSPATGDFRPKAGSALVDAGNAAYLVDEKLVYLPEGISRVDFAGNALDLTKTTCQVGAVQGTPVTPASGRVKVLVGETANGWKNTGRNSYTHADRFPATLVIRPADDGLFAFGDVTGCGGFKALYPQMDGTLHMVYPPVGTDRKWSEVAPAATLHVSPSAEAASADGSAAHPFRTLQSAMEYLDANKLSPVLVLAHPGTYAEGGSVCHGVMNRCVMPSGRAVRIKSTDGAAETTILGASDPGSSSVGFPGCGPQAVRCVAISNLASSCAIQGFTFKGGRTDCVKAGASLVASDAGAGVCAYDGKSGFTRNDLVVLDSIFDDCVSPNYSAGYRGVYFRCRFRNITSWGGLFRDAWLSGCFQEPTCSLGTKPEGAKKDAYMYVADMWAVHCTIPDGSVRCGTGNRSNLSNLIGASETRDNYLYWGTVFDAKKTTTRKGSGATYLSPLDLVDAANGDYRLIANSPTATAGTLPETGTDAWAVWAADYSTYASSDVDGGGLRLRDGKPMAGCFQTPVPTATIVQPNGGLSVQGANPSGRTLLDGIDEVSVKVDQSLADRQVVGCRINGGFREVRDGDSLVFRTADYAATDGFELEVVYGTNWYVNANTDPAAGVVGDDANSGYTPETPKRTLAGILSVPGMQSGDVVHAARGVYDEGEMDWDDQPKPNALRSRAVVPANVTLVGDEGAEKTVILGAAATENPGVAGMGTNAVRCVYLKLGSTLRGFTLTGGRTRQVDDDYATEGKDYTGAGVRGSEPSNRSKIRVESCIVSNNWAVNGAGVMGVTAVNCRIFDNHATNSGGGAFVANLYGSLVDWSYSGASSTLGGVHYFGEVVQTTVGPHNYSFATNYSGRSISSAYSTSARIAGSFFLGPAYTARSMTNLVVRSVFAAGTDFQCETNSCHFGTGKAAEWADERMRPVVGANPGIDQGSAEDLAKVGDDESDVSGFQRIMNGAPDIGALEADWRGRYGRDIGGSRTKVQEASPSVVEAGDGCVQVPEGAVVSAVWRSDGPEALATINYIVPEGCELAITLNGSELPRIVGTGSGEGSVQISGNRGDNALVFKSTAGTCKILKGRFGVGALLFIR